MIVKKNKISLTLMKVLDMYNLDYTTYTRMFIPFKSLTTDFGADYMRRVDPR